ncbi:structural protein [Bivalve RNA virus G5]|uniref:structural protein n=1 Tax=Bivalve RNA virus G5 TaxID=1926968 RepID=UPI00092D8233|nr:structural protein [Bivalve RNA virus G5]APJ38010.1 structural protein [Bivalve RNA virus G5]
MIATNSNENSNGSVSYDHDQNTIVDSTRGKLLTDVQMSADAVPMPSTSTQMALNDTTRHEIMSILERPVNLGTFEWKTSDGAIPIQLAPSDYTADTQNYLKQFNFPQDIFTNSPLVVDKLKNYQYFKADIEIEVKINAQPFLQGALMLVYNPYYDQTGDFRRKGTRFLASQTSCPYKIVSIEEGNSLKLICPYANIYDLFDLGNSQNQFGSAFLYVFSTLLGPNAAETAKYTVFARFINPQFFVPTQNDVISVARDAHEIKRLESKGYRVAQADVQPVSARDTGEVETPGPVSKVASGVTTVADVLSGIPVLGRFASTVAWVSRAVGKTAASFGWSKPTSIQPQSKAVLKPNNTLIHSEGNDDATTLALIQDNGIDGSSFIPETKDEMSFEYIFGRPNFFHSQTAATTLFSSRKLITAWEVSPLSQYQYGNTEDSQTMYLGSFSYLSMMGTLWRGTINYDIMVVKTPYHQGRFAVVFLPETNIADVPETLGELLNTNYNVVCNLKDRQDEMGRTTFRVSVPFISNTDWRETYKRTSNTDNPGPDATTLDTKTGCLALYSLVDLSNPPTVAGSVTFYVAHSGGEDYQIARPVMNLAPGFQSRYAQSDIGTVFVPEDENLLVPSHTTQDVTAQTTGEYFKSLRAFMKRYGWFADLSQQENYVGLRTRHMTEDPVSGERTISRNNLSDKVLPTPWYMASFLYRFYNGSSQLKVIPYTAGVVADSYLSFDESPVDQLDVSPQESYGQPLFQQNQQVSNAFEVRTPYYRGVRCDVVGSNQTPVLGDVRTNIRCRNRANFGGNSQTSSMFEAAGDDFNYFFMIGPPPMSDIRNVRSFSTFPTGNEVTVDLSGVTSVNEAGDFAFFIVADFSPDISITTNGNIAVSNVESVPLVTNEQGTIQVPVLSCTIFKSGPATGGIRVPLNGNTTAPGAAAAMAAVGSITVITDAPLA